jgi:hypothetical protein
MTAGRDAGPSSTLGPDARTGLVDPSGGYRIDALARRRAQRDAHQALARLRELLAAYDAGTIQLDELAYGAGLLGARLGAAACRGDLAS